VKRHNEMVLARKARRGWSSKKTLKKSKQMRGNDSTLKQNSRDATRFWWAPVLMKGKLHVVVLGEDFPGESPEGAAILVSKVRSAVNLRFPNDDDKPDTFFTDKGRGFYSGTSKICHKYRDALAEHDFKAFCGDDASHQPGNLQELLLHETSVSWIRRREKITRSRAPWEETEEEFTTRIKSIVQEINDTLNVDGLCRALPKRIQMLVDAEGDRICK